MKYLLILPLLLIPTGCAAMADLLGSPVQPPPVTAPEEPGQEPTPEDPVAYPVPTPTVGDKLSEIIGGLVGALTGNPVVGVATIATVSMGTGAFVKKYQSKKKEKEAAAKASTEA